LGGGGVGASHRIADVLLLAQLACCPASKPLLTTYPLGYTTGPGPGPGPPGERLPAHRLPTLLCADGWRDQQSGGGGGGGGESFLCVDWVAVPEALRARRVNRRRRRRR
jgi:hypothetical protein